MSAGAKGWSVVETTNYMAADRAAQEAFYVTEVAKAAFPYPNDEYPNRSWHVNLPEVTVEVPLPGKRSIAPDIVVLEGAERTAVFCGEVITFRQAMEPEVETRWRPIPLVSRLVVFVPVGRGSEAKTLIKKAKLDALLYTYRWTPRGAEILPVT
jgi:hypothetical protein